jgi:hypothetical protein
MKNVLLLLFLGGLLTLGWYSTHSTLDPALLRRATREYAARKGQLGNRKYLTIIDYSLNIIQPRLFVYDVVTHRIVLRSRVSHALSSGLLYATDFSNEVGSEKSCYGTFVTHKENYNGKFGTALRLNGISGAVNDQALIRAVVFHADPGYQFSKGCFMTSTAVNNCLISMIQGRSLVVVNK